MTTHHLKAALYLSATLVAHRRPLWDSCSP